jgi:hypothetical protein
MPEKRLQKAREAYEERPKESASAPFPDWVTKECQKIIEQRHAEAKSRCWIS